MHLATVLAARRRGLPLSYIRTLLTFRWNRTARFLYRLVIRALTNMNILMTVVIIIMRLIVIVNLWGNMPRRTPISGVISVVTTTVMNRVIVMNLIVTMIRSVMHLIVSSISSC